MTCLLVPGMLFAITWVWGLACVRFHGFDADFVSLFTGLQGCARLFGMVETRIVSYTGSHTCLAILRPSGRAW